MYLSITNHLGLHISEPIYKTLVGPSTFNPRSANVNGCSVLRGAQAVGFGPHLSYLISIYKSKIIKYMYMVQCPIHCNRKVVIHYHESYESHSHIHESTYFILFALLKVHPRFFPRLDCVPRGAAPLSVGMRLVKYTCCYNKCTVRLSSGYWNS
jgi:hypothetical protein